jgi:hypothetical protein
MLFIHCNQKQPLFFFLFRYLGLVQLILPMKTIFVISERVAALSLVVAIVAGIAGVLHVFALHVLYHVMLLNAATNDITGCP